VAGGGDGEPLGRRDTSRRKRALAQLGGDSHHILYQSLDKLRIVDIETGETRTVPLDLKYTPACRHDACRPRRKLVDMKSAHRAYQRRRDHRRQSDYERRAARDANHTASGGRRSNLSVMPGLTSSTRTCSRISASRRAARFWRSASRRSAVPATRRTRRSKSARRTRRRASGPRVFGTGYLMEWQRVYYKMGIAISSVAQFEMELQRAKVLQHDLIKSYVRLPDLQQKRMVEFAHSIGVPVATHEIYRRRSLASTTRSTPAHQPARLLAEDSDAVALVRGRRPAVRKSHAFSAR
jgi:hypothetical protein